MDVGQALSMGAATEGLAFTVDNIYGQYKLRKQHKSGLVCTCRLKADTPQPLIILPPNSCRSKHIYRPCTDYSNLIEILYSG